MAALLPLTPRQIDSKKPPCYAAQHRVGPLPGGFLFPEWVALFTGIHSQGYSVRFATAQAVMASLVKAHSDDNLDNRLAFYAKPKLLIVD